MDRQGKEKEAGIIITIILVVAFAIKLAQFLFPVFIILGIICLMLLIASFVWFEDASVYIAIALGICLLGGTICWGVGYEFGESAFGVAFTTSADAINQVRGVEKQVAITMLNETQKINKDLNQNTSPDSSKAIDTSIELTKVAIKVS